MVNANEILPEAEQHRTKWKNYVRDAADIFHNEEGEIFERSDAIEKLTEELDIEEDTARQTLSALVGDVVDPVVQIPTPKDKYVGVIEYHEYNGAYGYCEFDDVNGERNRVVCARCVETASHDREVTHATSGSGSFDEDAGFDELYDAVVEHYNQSHDVMPANVETGATLLSGTTIGGNTAYHTGNESSLKVPSGVISMWSGATTDVPSGWTLCDGSDPRTNSSSVPDLRNRFVAGAGDEYVVGDTGGEKQHQLTVGEMPSHSHNVPADDIGSSSSNNGAATTSGDAFASINTSAAGNDEAHENRPRFYSLAFIMKV